MENIQFTDEEIKEQLEALGYFNVSQERIKQFKKDLHSLIQSDTSSVNQSWTTGSTATDLDNSSFFKPSSGALQPKKPTKVAFNLLPGTSKHVNTNLQPGKSKHVNTNLQPGTSKQPVLSNYQPKPQISSNTHQAITTEVLTDQDSSFVTNEATVDEENVAMETTNDEYCHDNNDITDDVIQSSDDVMGCSVRSLLSNNSLSSGEHRVIQKRKVSRKQKDGTSKVFNESLLCDENHRVFRNNHYDVMGEMGSESSSVVDVRPHTARPHTARPHTARPLGRRADSNSPPSIQLPSFIRPDVYPKTQLKKQDPVEKYGEYKEYWECNNIPTKDGNRHKELRWQIKAQMLYKEEPATKPTRVYVPNNYVVPTTKKRSKLRWQVRHALARGLKPETGSFELY